MSDLPLSSEPEPGFSRAPEEADLTALVQLRGDGGWDWVNAEGYIVKGPRIDSGGDIVVAVSVPSAPV